MTNATAMCSSTEAATAFGDRFSRTRPPTRARSRIGVGRRAALRFDDPSFEAALLDDVGAAVAPSGESTPRGALSDAFEADGGLVISAAIPERKA